MEQIELQELETKLSVLEAGGEIFKVIQGLAAKVGALELEVALLADATAKFYDVLKGLAALDAQQRARLKAEAEALTKRQKPKPGGGQVH